MANDTSFFSDFTITIIVVSIVVKKSQKYFKSQQDYLGHVNGQVEEVYSGHNIVKAFNGEEKARQTFQKANEELYHSGMEVLSFYLA